MLLLNQEA